MKYKKIVLLNDEQFRRETGVKRKTFNVMVNILKKEDAKKKIVGGGPKQTATGRKISDDVGVSQGV